MKRLVFVTLMVVLVASGLSAAAQGPEAPWVQISPNPPGCPQWQRLGAEYHPPSGMAYILGGRSGATYLGNIYAYDPVANACTDTGVSMPIAVSNHQVVLLTNETYGDMLCTFGFGYASNMNTGDVQCYRPAQNDVIVLTTLPAEFGPTDNHRFGPGGVVVVDNKAYVFGGFRGARPSTADPFDTTITFEYDPVADTWTQLGNLSVARAYIHAAAADGKVYAFGGTYCSAGTLTCTALTVVNAAEVLDLGTGMWTSIPSLPAIRGEGAAFGFDSDSYYPELAGKVVIVAGGLSGRTPTTTCLVYDPVGQSYTSYDSKIVAKRNFTKFFVPGEAEATPGCMYTFGGRLGSDSTPHGLPEYSCLAFEPPPPCDPPTDVDFDWDPAEPFAGEEVTFTGTAAGTEPLEYAWSFGATGSVGYHTFDDPGEYEIELCVTNACGEECITHTVTVHDEEPPPPEEILKINRMKLNWRYARPPWINMAALVRVFDGNNQVVEGAAVEGEWTLPDDSVVPGVPFLGATDYLGREKFQLRDDLGGLYKFCVTDITKAGYLYDPDQNMDGPCIEQLVPAP